MAPLRRAFFGTPFGHGSLTIPATEQNAARLVPFSCWRTSMSGLGGRGDMPGNLIYWALVLIVIALVAAFLGFGGVAGTAMSGAHLLIWLAVVIVIVGVVFALIRRA
jgi:uncharacterized membrane protein YtjA (UPF0391 family)